MEEAPGRVFKLGVAAIHALGHEGSSREGGGMLSVVRDILLCSLEGRSKQAGM